MEWTKGKNKLVFYHIGANWLILMLVIDKFEISLIHDIKRLSVGVSFDRWLLSKQLTFSFFSLSLGFILYSTNDNDWEL